MLSLFKKTALPCRPTSHTARPLASCRSDPKRAFKLLSNLIYYAQKWRKLARKPVIAAGMSSGLLVMWDTRDKAYPYVVDVHEKAVGERGALR